MISSAAARISRRTIAGLFAFLFLCLAHSRGADFAIGPDGASRVVGGTVTFSVVTAPSATGAYQWYFNDTPLVHATEATLILAGLAPSQTGNYRLQCSPASGPVQWSNTLALNVVSPLPSPVDTSFTAAAIPGSTATIPIAVASNGSILVRVTVPTTDNPYVWHYARLHADGSLDPTFNYPDSAGTLLANFPDGGMITSQAPYRLKADGSPAAFTFPAAFDASKSFTAGVQSDGRFLLGQGTTLLRFNADGTPDPTFTYAPAQVVTINAIEVDFKDRIMVYGRYDPVLPGDSYAYYIYDFRLTSIGTVDATFHAWTMPYRPSPYNTLYSGFAPLADGGYFRTMSNIGQRGFIFVGDDGVEVGRGGGSVYEHGPGFYLSRRLFQFADYDGAVQRQMLLAYRMTDTGPAIEATCNAGQPDGVIGSSSMSDGYLGDGLLQQPDGQLLVGGTFTSWDGHATTNLARLRLTSAPMTPIVSVSYDRSLLQVPHAGYPYTLTSSVYGGSRAYAYQWLALDGQPLPANSSSDTLVFPFFARNQRGRYQLRVTGPTGTTFSPVLELSAPVESQPRLVNLSGRAIVGTGENTLIAGVVTADSTQVLMRGAGPALQPLGVARFLPDPVLNLTRGDGTLIGHNDNWGDELYLSDLTAFAARAGAFAFASGSLDAAKLTSLNQGPNTVQLCDRTGATGVGLVEIYEDPASVWNSPDALLNLSFRAHTAPGEATAIAGFVVDDPEGLGRSLRLVLRVVGPTLATQGVQHPLADPVLTLSNAQGEIIKRVDNWSDDPDLATLKATMKQVGAFDLTPASKDAAVVLDLSAGVYTMSATGADVGSGVALLEIYLVR